MRVVSLLPSATEILAIFGAHRLLVGRSHECDHPPGLGHLPVLTAPAEALAPDPGAIDRAVRARMAEARPLYTLDTAALASLRPDLILTQDVCRVCSIDLDSVRSLAATLDPVPGVLSLNPDGLDAVLDDILTVGAAVGMEAPARDAVVRLRERLFRAAEYVPSFHEGPSVAFLEWTDPLFIGGHWTPQLIERAGARHPLNPTVAPEDAGAAAGPQQASRKAGRSVRIPPEVLLASRPDALIICPCGRSLAQARADAAALAAEPWFRDLPAVRAGRVALVDGNQMFNRPGPRLLDAFEWLVAWLNDRPSLIPAGFPWEPF